LRVREEPFFLDSRVAEELSEETLNIALTEETVPTSLLLSSGEAWDDLDIVNDVIELVTEAAGLVKHYPNDVRWLRAGSVVTGELYLHVDSALTVFGCLASHRQA
jgi:hypothetical protein